MTSSSTHNIFNTSPLYFSVTGMKDIFAFCLLLSWFVCSWPRPMSVQQTVPANGNEAAEHSLRWRRFFENGEKNVKQGLFKIIHTKYYENILILRSDQLYGTRTINEQNQLIALGKVSHSIDFIYTYNTNLQNVKISQPYMICIRLQISLFSFDCTYKHNEVWDLWQTKNFNFNLQISIQMLIYLKLFLNEAS